MDNERSRNFKIFFNNDIFELFEASDGWCNGSMFNVTWRRENVILQNGEMRLMLDRDTSDLVEGIPYSGGEYRSLNYYGFGKYEVSMRAVKNDGVVSSFFVYTGPSDNNPWDEVDIEFLGRDTTKVQFNYFSDGIGDHEYLYDLGFDASKEFHTCSFEWHKRKIIWYVDGRAVYSADTDIPGCPGKIMMNVWCGIGVDRWLNAFNEKALPLSAEYRYISFESYDE